MRESLGKCCWKGGWQRRTFLSVSILCYSRLQSLTSTVTRINTGIFFLPSFYLSFINIFNCFPIWILWILFFALCHNLKWIDVWLHFIAHLFLLLSSTYGHNVTIFVTAYKSIQVVVITSKICENLYASPFTYTVKSSRIEPLPISLYVVGHWLLLAKLLLKKNSLPHTSFTYFVLYSYLEEGCSKYVRDRKYC